jgi:hypothetical protein
MSATLDPHRTAAAEPDAPSGETDCTRCGAPLAADQEWCLECGTGRTIIHGPPDWRIAVAIVAAVIVLALAGFGIALANLSNSANRSAATIAAAATPPAATTVTPAKSVATAKPKVRFPGWAIGLSGWTVELASSPTLGGARRQALALRGRGLKVGILQTSKHPQMVPGSYVVFTGRFANLTQAEARVQTLVTEGQSQARAVLVGKPTP